MVYIIYIHRRIEDIALQNGILHRQCVKCTEYFFLLDFENYLLHSNYRDIISLSKLRCSNSKLPIYKHITILKFFMCTYQRQSVMVNWNGECSSAFSVGNGVKQGGVLSPVLFTVSFDGLIDQLRKKV